MTTQTRPIEPLSGMALMIAAIAIGLASFMAVTDITIANVSVPSISGDLGVSPEIGEWTITFFAIANSICIPLTGWLSRRFGQLRLFIMSVTAFTIASLLCGMAQSFESLLAFRILQGVVSGPIVPLSQALLVAIFPPSKRTFALSMWAMTNMAGPVAGPVLGGWLTDAYSWPWIFFVNLPIGLIVVVVTGMMLKGRDTATAKLPIDTRGLILLALAIGTLQLTLDRGRILDWFSSPFIITTSIICVLSFIFFVIWELGDKHPIVDLTLFKYRNFSIGTIAVAVGFGLYFAALVLIPLWLQIDMRYTATWAGLATAPMGIFGILLAPLLGRWIQRNDARIFASLAFIAWSLVAWWRTSMTTEVDVSLIALSCLAQGIGIGLFLTPLVSLSLNGIPPEKIASASGLQTSIRMMAGSLIASLAQTYWDQRSRYYQNVLVDSLEDSRPAVATTMQQMTAQGLTEQQSWQVIWRETIIQADMLALNDFFLWSSIAFALSIVVIWFARNPQALSTKK
ncbi:DHA2 family efflux MFS transporter permease subunit [Acinetobacter larvae]|uniref:MFS transporter n=1 Tax=Acinetobacter larvae TaxID=1789224 RepID=A0A1B2M150_9GAMM|nr:DHA2 family efflux MFS transporter permease subunit [Acinetobacter larvae]AOA58924.1 MFS transporter [Acinetobacter larvae]